MSNPLPSPLPIKPAPTAREPIDFQLMIELWHSGNAGRDAALEMADRNRVNARSEK